MADELRNQIAITFNRETPAETIRLFDETLLQEPTAYTKGEIVLAASEADRQIADDVNAVFISAESAITIKIGGTTETPQTSMRMFGYNGAPTDIFLTNTDTLSSVKVTYITAKIV